MRGSASASGVGRDAGDGAKRALALSATAGGGAVKVTMTGDQKCQSVEIDPALLKDADAEMLQDLVLTAMNLALDKSREKQEQLMGPLAGGLPF